MHLHGKVTSNKERVSPDEGEVIANKEKVSPVKHRLDLNKTRVRLIKADVRFISKKAPGCIGGLNLILSRQWLFLY